MQRPSLASELEQFMYTHAQNSPIKRRLMEIVKKWESAYQARIFELENPVKLEPESKPDLPGFGDDGYGEYKGYHTGD